MTSEADVRHLFDFLRYLRDAESGAGLDAWSADLARTESILGLLREHRLLGHCYWLARRSRLLEHLPPVAAAELDEAYRAQAECARQNLQLLGELKRAFGVGNIDFMVLKGLYISRRFYGDSSSRFMWDLDILVAPGNLHRAAAEAGRLGLTPRSRSTVDPADPRLGIHALELKGERGKLDIHVALRNLPGIDIDLERQWQQVRCYEIDGISLPCASDEDTLFMSCLGLGTDLQRGRYNLRKIWDVCVMVAQMDGLTDWDRFFAQREREGALRLVLNTCALAIQLAGCTDDCPHLGQALERRSHLLQIRTAEQAFAIYQLGRSPLRNRLLFSRLLPVAAWRYWAQMLRWVPARRSYYRGTGREL